MLARQLGAVLTREPGGTAIGGRIRQLLLDRGDRRAWPPAARRCSWRPIGPSTWRTSCGPALDAGRHVVADRYLYSSVAYQGFGRGLPPEEVRRLSLWAADGLEPDLVLLLDGPCRLRWRRLTGSRTRTTASGPGWRPAIGPRPRPTRPAGLGSTAQATWRRRADEVTRIVAARPGLGVPTRRQPPARTADGCDPDGSLVGVDDSSTSVVGQPEAARPAACVVRPPGARLPASSAPRARASAERPGPSPRELLAAGRRVRTPNGTAAWRWPRPIPTSRSSSGRVRRSSRDQVRRVVEQAVRSPVEGDRKVLLLTEFHLVLDAAPILLKSVEEPPPSTFFLILADEVPPELVTIASRCVVVPFHPLAAELVVAQLVAEGVAPDAAAAGRRRGRRRPGAGPDPHRRPRSGGARRARGAPCRSASTVGVAR